MARNGFQTAPIHHIGANHFSVPGSQAVVSEKVSLTGKLYVPARRLAVQADQECSPIKANTTPACLPDSTLRDVEQRMEQLAQVQMGFLCEQLAAFRQEHVDHVSNVRRMLEADKVKQEHLERQEIDGTCARHADEDLKGALDAQNKGKEKLKQDLEKTRALMQLQIRRCEEREASLKSTSSHVAKRCCEEDRLIVASPRKELSVAETNLQSILQDMHQSLQCQISNCSAEIEKLTAHSKSTDAALQAERIAKQQVALELEQIRGGMESINKEQAMHTQEEQTLRLLVETVSCSLDELRQRHETAREQTRQFEVQSHARNTESAKLQDFLTEQDDALRRLEYDFGTLRSEQQAHGHSCEKFSENLLHLESCLPAAAVCNNITDVLEAERITRTEEFTLLSCRIDECMEHGHAARRIDKEFKNLLDLETKFREEGDISLAQSFQTARDGLREDLEELANKERMARTLEFRKLSSSLEERAFAVEKAQTPDNLVSQLETALAEEENKRIQLQSEVQIWIGREAKAREEVDVSLWSCLQESLQRLDVVDQDVQKTKAVSADLEVLRLGLQKVVEVARHEHEKLREDCCDAIQNAWRINGIPDPFLGSTGSAPQSIRRV